jgi:transposase InsO family protein
LVFFSEEDIKMPWKEVSKVDSRRLFISAVESGMWDFSQVCRQFDISRKTGYKWLHRFWLESDEGLYDRSRRPHRVYYATDPQVRDFLLAERDLHPAWGARKLCKRLEKRGATPPPERTANRILKRNGKIMPPKAFIEEEPKRFERAHPNDLWQVDHKSAIHGRWARRTVPFVVLDDCTRYLLGLKALSDKGLYSTWEAIWHIFGEFGLPNSILADNDQIFHGSNGPSHFEARLLRLGIDILHGRPYHPQTQGKAERLNGTLERELLRNGSFESAEELQAGFDRFRNEYNYERPHESLSMEVPGAFYRPSARPRPKKLPEMEYPVGAILRKVHKDGWLSYKGYCIEVGVALHGQHVEIREVDYGVEVYYGQYRIRGKQLDEHTMTRDYKVGGTRPRRGTSLRATPFAPFPEEKKV